uniref:Zinc finger protein 845 n=1 Tax=Cacopsylla melanoneura TaxID=428564 RepID=A0A8D8PR15_9HEMI
MDIPYTPNNLPFHPSTSVAYAVPQLPHSLSNYVSNYSSAPNNYHMAKATPVVQQQPSDYSIPNDYSYRGISSHLTQLDNPIQHSHIENNTLSRNTQLDNSVVENHNVLHAVGLKPWEKALIDSTTPSNCSSYDECHMSNPGESVTQQSHDLETGTFYCPNCNEQFTCDEDVFEHYKTFHQKRKMYKCSECFKEFTCKYNLKLHIQRVHTLSAPKFPCHMCTKEYASKQYLLTHVRTAHNKKYRCHLCPNQYVSEQFVMLHISRDHIQSGKKYPCHLCSNEYATKQHLRFHLKEHEEKVQCAYCNKQFPGKAHIKTHFKRCHNTFNCKKCQLDFPNGVKLRSHNVKTHGSVIQKAKCDECGKCFRNEAFLQQHIVNGHTNKLEIKQVVTDLKQDLHKESHMTEESNAAADSQQESYVEPNLQQELVNQQPDEIKIELGVSHFLEGLAEKTQQGQAENKNIDRMEQDHEEEEEETAVTQSKGQKKEEEQEKEAGNDVREEEESEKQSEETTDAMETDGKVENEVKEIEEREEDEPKEDTQNEEDVKQDENEEDEEEEESEDDEEEENGLRRSSRKTQFRYKKIRVRYDKNGRVLCPQCPNTFKRRSGMYQHVRSCHDKIRFNCTWSDKCDGTFATTSSLSRHLDWHRGKKFRCDDCGKSFSTKDTLNEHIKTVHLGQTYNCSDCPKTFLKKQGLIAHISNEHTGVLFECIECTKTFRFKSSYARHLKTEHGVRGQFRDTQTIYKCPHCTRRFFSLLALKGHIGNATLAHSGILMVCSVCLREFQNKGVFSRHLVTHREKGELIYKCERCSANYFKSEKMAMAHVKRKHFVEYEMKKLQEETAVHEKQARLTIKERKRYNCKLCDRSYTKSASLSAHVKTNHLGVMFKCPHCEKEFAQKHGLKNHVSNIHEGVIYECSVCNKVYQHKISLRLHMKQHNGEEFRCRVCLNKFAYKETLNNHMVTQHGEAQHKCSLCGKKFEKRKFLLTHIEIEHPGQEKASLLEPEEVLHKCSSCGKRFRKRRDLRQHVETMHGDRKIKTHTIGKPKLEPSPQQDKGKDSKRIVRDTQVDDDPVLLESLNFIPLPKEPKHKCSLCAKKFVHEENLLAHMSKEHCEGIKKTVIPVVSKPKVVKPVQHIVKPVAQRKVQQPLPQRSVVPATVNQTMDAKEAAALKGLQKCALCPKKFERRELLLSHMQRDHKKGAVQCKVCGQRYATELFLAKHMRNHEGVPGYRDPNNSRPQVVGGSKKKLTPSGGDKVETVDLE